MRFVYPMARQFPFDGVCGQIVRELQRRDFQVPGISVTLCEEYGSSEVEKPCYASSILSSDFQLYFRRPQQTPDNQCLSEVSEIIIPKQQLCVYEDESGPTLYLYVGNDYEKDREEFVYGSKVNGRIAEKPRTYLVYRGECHCQNHSNRVYRGTDMLLDFLCGDLADPSQKLATRPHTHPGERPPLLVHTNYSGDEYDPEGDEPRFFRTDKVMREFKQYLERVVLRGILSHPIPTDRRDC